VTAFREQRGGVLDVVERHRDAAPEHEHRVLPERAAEAVLEAPLFGVDRAWPDDDQLDPVHRPETIADQALLQQLRPCVVVAPPRLGLERSRLVERGAAGELVRAVDGEARDVDEAAAPSGGGEGIEQVLRGRDVALERLAPARAGSGDQVVDRVKLRQRSREPLRRAPQVAGEHGGVAVAGLAPGRARGPHHRRHRVTARLQLGDQVPTEEAAAASYERLQT